MPGTQWYRHADKVYFDGAKSTSKRCLNTALHDPEFINVAVKPVPQRKGMGSIRRTAIGLNRKLRTHESMGDDRKEQLKQSKDTKFCKIDNQIQDIQK